MFGNIQEMKELVKKTKELKILYVEDNKEARTQMIKMLKNFFENIEIAVNGQDGFEKYKESNFDIVLTDINMPKLNGIEMIKLILKKNEDQKIVVLSAYNDSEYLQQCLELGIKHYLYKPIQIQTLLTTLNKLVKSIYIQKENQELHHQIDEILVNAEAGYVLFNKHFKCLKIYSQKSLDIFNLKDIENQKICVLLFGKNQDKKEIFIEGIKNILNTKDKISKELFLSLLPNEEIINHKNINIKYKILENDRFMAILEDVTDKKGLEKELKRNNNILKMLVAITTNIDDFLQLKKDYEDFLNKPPKTLEKIFRNLHTFKGNFAQKELLYTPQEIHNCETNIKQNNSLSKKDILKLKHTFEKDLNIIKTYYGEEYLSKRNLLFINENALKEIEHKIKNISTIDNTIKNNIDEILFYINKLRYIRIYDMLSYYKKHINTKSRNLGKLVYPLEIEGDIELLGNPKLRAFFKTLVHLFNNCIDHGIEDSQTRLALNKDEYGTIKCSYEQIKNTLILQISDDGAGIDTKKLLQKAIKLGLVSKEKEQSLSLKENYMFIFTDFISTKDSVDMTSGRGVGMSAIKYELDKLGGEVIINSTKNKGTIFKFILPLNVNETFKSNIKDEYMILNAISNQLLNIFDYQINIKDDRFLDDFPFEKRLQHINIVLEAKKSYKCIVSFSNLLIDNLFPVFMGESFSKKDMVGMEGELAKEVSNTIIGLSLCEFPNNIGEVDISIPIQISTSKLKELFSKAKIKTMKIYSTNKGTMYISLIQL